MPSTRKDGSDFSDNEKIVMSLLRRSGQMSRAELASATGLSAQSATNISRQLIDRGMLSAGESIRGKVGQPSIPLTLDPDGALFLGLKLGRRLVELALVDFSGQVRLHRQEIHPFPEPERVLNFARNGIATFLSTLPQAARDRIVGLGIAAPFRLWDWGEEMAAWQQVDLRAELANGLPFPVFLENDATTACAGELIFGRHQLPADFLHLYIAHFPGGGLVLDGKLRFGPNRNAAALGSILLPGGKQLLESASVASLEQRLGRALPPDDSAWKVPADIEEDWIRQAGDALAYVALAATSIVDLTLIIVDGAVPPGIRSRLTDATRDALANLRAEGIDRPDVIEGSLGRNARILGAVALPLTHFFQPEGGPG